MYTFKKFTSLPPPMQLQILQVLIQATLHPQQHLLLQIVVSGLIGLNEVSILLADRWPQN